MYLLPALLNEATKKKKKKKSTMSTLVSTPHIKYINESHDAIKQTKWHNWVYIIVQGVERQHTSDNSI